FSHFGSPRYSSMCMGGCSLQIGSLLHVLDLARQGRGSRMAGNQRICVMSGTPLQPNATLQARPIAGARHERRLLGVACRVEPMVTHPAPPQTRTCAIHAYGSSAWPALRQSAGAELLLPSRSPLAFCGQGW